jgi:hypothetical protein
MTEKTVRPHSVLRKITGTAWSGPLFFGLKPNRPATRRSSQLQGPADEPMESRNAASLASEPHSPRRG